MSEFSERLQSVLGDTYRLERELGGGGMSRVFLAEEVGLGRKVVIKVLPPEMAAGVNKERFRRETQLAASLQHPLIVPILTAGAAAESGDGSDLLYYVMPFIDGQSLREKLDEEGELSVGTAVRIFRDVADALAAAHARGVVHRDIKPGNVMLSGKHAVVTDFGVAKAVSASQDTAHGGLTQMGMALGTPMYMAPEQAAGDLGTDHRADIYALGIMAYEMLTGRIPFEAATPQGLLAAHLSETPAPVTTRRGAVSGALGEVVMRCLEKQPADRWQSAAELSAVLDDLSGSSGALTPSATRPLHAVGAAAPPGPGRVALLASAGAGVLALVAYLAMMQFGLPDWTLWGAAALGAVGVALSTASAVTARRGTGGWSWRRTRRTLGTAFGLFAAAVATYSAMRVLGIGPVGTLVASGLMDERGRLIVADFENFTADSTLGETVTELLRIDLAQSPAVTLLEGAQMAGALRRMERDPMAPVGLELAREMAEREGVAAVLAGEVRPVGNDVVVAARLVAAGTGETLAAGRETAIGGDVIGAVDRLSAALRERIGESLKTIRADAPLDQVTTGSTGALRTYALAERVNNVGDLPRAITLLEETLAEDSLFAMAHRKLGVLLTNANRDPDRARAAFTRAYELRDRLTDRERLLAEAAYYNYVAGDMAASVQAYEALLETYPDDRTALNNLALAYAEQGRLREAEALFRRSIANRGAPAATLGNAIELQYRLGMADTAEATYRAFAEQYPEHAGLPRYPAAFAAARLDHDEAERLLREWATGDARGNPLSEMMARFDLAMVLMARGRFEESAAELRGAFDAQDRLGAKEINLAPEIVEALVGAQVDLWFRDDPDGAAARLDRALDALGYDALPADERDDLQLAAVFARAGRFERARELIRRFEAANPEKAGARASAQLLGAQGELALAEARFADAVGLLRAARDQAHGCTPCFLMELGEAYAGAGEPDSAVAALEEYLSAHQLFRASIDNTDLWAVLMQMGELYEERGDAERAVGAYNRLLELWESADPVVGPRTDDVRGRIARLVGERAP